MPEDDTETLDFGLAANAHKRLRNALSLCENDFQERSPESVIMKKLFSAVVLDCLEIDLAPSREMIKCYTDAWLKVADTRPIPFTTLDEYFEYRSPNSGVPYVYSGVSVSQL